MNKYKEALQKIANKNNQPLATTINGLRTQLRFVLNIATEALKEPTEPRMFSEEEVRTYTYRELERFGVYLMSGDYIHTITNNKELVEHCKKQAQAFTGLADYESIEPNQTEAEKVLEKYFPNPDDLVNGRVKNVIIKAMEEYASLTRKQVIEEVEEFVDERSNRLDSISHLVLLKYLQTLKP